MKPLFILGKLSWASKQVSQESSWWQSSNLHMAPLISTYLRAHNLKFHITLSQQKHSRTTQLSCWECRGSIPMTYHQQKWWISLWTTTTLRFVGVSSVQCNAKRDHLIEYLCSCLRNQYLRRPKLRSKRVSYIQKVSYTRTSILINARKGLVTLTQFGRHL